MDSFSHVPPGFRFHPTDEELVDYYLRKKIASKRIDLDVIKDVDLYKIEPWDLQELCRIGSEEQNEWYFFSHKDKKYPTGTRTNRATRAGFWKATGRDKAIYSRNCLIGMRKTLVFYKGRAPNGQKSDWIMHEYRLETNENGTPQEEGWVVCRVFKKRITTVSRREGDHDPLCWYEDQVSFMPDFDSPRRLCQQPPYNAPPYHHQHHPHQYPCKQELDNLQYNNMHHHHHHHPHDAFLQLPQLESPKVPHHQNTNASCSSSSVIPLNNNNVNNSGGSNFLQSPSLTQDEQNQLQSVLFSNQQQQAVDDQVATDWRVLDRFVASQLSHEINNNNNNNNNDNGSKETTSGNQSNGGEDLNLLMNDPKTAAQDMASSELGSSSSPMDHHHMWK